MTVQALKLETQQQAMTPWWATSRSRWMGLISLAIAILGAGTWFFLFRPYVSTDDARVASTLVRIASQGSLGRIEKVNVSEGDRVKAGDVLIEIDHRMAQAQFEKSRSRLNLATTDAKRAELLSAQHGLPARDLDRVKSELGIAKAEFDLASIALENTFLRSPINGVVVQKNADVGNLLEPGQGALTVADVDHAWIAANIEETAIREVKLGQSVSVRIDEGGVLSGKVAEIRGASAAQFALIPSDNAAGNFTKLVQRIPVKIAIDAENGRFLKVGESVEVQIRVK